MIGKAVAVAIAVCCLSGAARADAAMPDTAGGRYIFQKRADGVLRLDTQSGEVSLCSQRAVGWACEAAPEDRAVLEDEIARLRAENGALKQAILARGLPLPPGIVPEPAQPPLAQNNAAPDNALNLRLPSDAEIDRVVSFAGRVWQRFVDAIERARKQVLNKG